LKNFSIPAPRPLGAGSEMQQKTFLHFLQLLEKNDRNEISSLFFGLPRDPNEFQISSLFLVPGLKFANGNKKEFAPFFTKNFILFWLKNPSKKFFFVFVDFFWKLKKARLKNFLFAALFLLPNPF